MQGHNLVQYCLYFHLFYNSYWNCHPRKRKLSSLFFFSKQILILKKKKVLILIINLYTIFEPVLIKRVYILNIKYLELIEYSHTPYSAEPTV